MRVTNHLLSFFMKTCFFKLVGELWTGQGTCITICYVWTNFDFVKHLIGNDSPGQNLWCLLQCYPSPAVSKPVLRAILKLVFTSLVFFLYVMLPNNDIAQIVKEFMSIIFIIIFKPKTRIVLELFHGVGKLKWWFGLSPCEQCK